MGQGIYKRQQISWQGKQLSATAISHSYLYWFNFIVYNYNNKT